MKLFGKISVMDLLIIMLVLAVIAAAAVYFGRHGTGFGNVETTPIIYEVMVKQVEDGEDENISAGDKVLDRVKGYDRGVVQEVRMVLHSEKTTDLTTGRQRLEEYPDLYDMIVRINADAEVTDRYVMLSGNRMDIGKEAYLQIGEKVYKSWVSSIEISGKEPVE